MKGNSVDKSWHTLNIEFGPKISLKEHHIPRKPAMPWTVWNQVTKSQRRKWDCWAWEMKKLGWGMTTVFRCWHHCHNEEPGSFRVTQEGDISKHQDLQSTEKQTQLPIREICPKTSVASLAREFLTTPSIKQCPAVPHPVTHIWASPKCQAWGRNDPFPRRTQC